MEARSLTISENTIDPDIKFGGIGTTQMLNDDGFMCCLGQFTPQLNREVDKEKMLGISCPGNVSLKLGTSIPGLSIMYKNSEPVDTNLSYQAISINDTESTTPDQKIKLLKALFRKYKHKITVINKP